MVAKSISLPEKDEDWRTILYAHDATLDLTTIEFGLGL